MALVVFVKGINVGGHRRFRPRLLATALKRYDVVNVGATGILVVRKPISRAKLRAELKKRLPFEAELMICDGRDIARLAAHDPFAGKPSRPDIVRFVSFFAKRPRATPRIPATLPAEGAWGLLVLGHSDRFAFGLYRRQMKATGYLSKLDKMFGVPVTTRSWSTILTVAKILKQ